MKYYTNSKQTTLSELPTALTAPWSVSTSHRRLPVSL